MSINFKEFVADKDIPLWRLLRNELGIEDKDAEHEVDVTAFDGLNNSNLGAAVVKKMGDDGKILRVKSVSNKDLGSKAITKWVKNAAGEWRKVPDGYKDKESNDRIITGKRWNDMLFNYLPPEGSTPPGAEMGGMAGGMPPMGGGL